MTTHLGVLRMNDNQWYTFLGRTASVVGIPLLLLLVGVQLSKQSAMQDAISGLVTRMSVLENKVDVTSNDQYHGSDARRDFSYRDQAIKQTEDHVESLDTRVQTLEVQSARGNRR